MHWVNALVRLQESQVKIDIDAHFIHDFDVSCCQIKLLIIQTEIDIHVGEYIWNYIASLTEVTDIQYTFNKSILWS